MNELDKSEKREGEREIEREREREREREGRAPLHERKSREIKASNFL